jgi:Tol biopolymer transport system component
MSNRDGDWEIYMMVLPERGVQNLTNNDADDGFGTFSADGAAMTFLSNRVPEEGLTAYMMDADGTNVSRVQNDLPTILNVLATGRLNWDFTFQPPSRVTFVSLRDLNLEVYIQTQNDDEQPSEDNLSESSAIDWFPAPSPDGTRIAFASDQDGNQEIYVMNVDGTGLRRITDHPADDLFPAWAADNHQIIFYSERDTTLANGTLALYIVDVDAENPTPVILEGDALFIDERTPLLADFQYRQDGSAQLYMAHDGDDWELYYADSVGRFATNLTANDADDLFPVWR